VLGIGAVAGIGFTVSLFVAELAFVGERLAAAKIGILAASLAAAVLGATMLWWTHRRETSRS
jgi:Na+:H+ antiporter, NhaA family